MNPWDRRQWPPSTPKKPAPEHGIKVKKSGATWWGQRWIDALEVVLRGSSGRLARGRSYARAGRTHDLVVEGGTVRAKVTGSRQAPYDVTIELAQLPARVWDDAIARMAAKAQFAAELLAGEMPRDIADVFRDAGAALFPAERSELVTKCSCPDWGDPCKHVAATHYVLGEALDRDPFLLFELRGRTKEQVFAALRAVRGGRTPGPEQDSGLPAKPDDAVPTVLLGNLDPADYDRPRAPLPALQLSFEAPVTHGAVLRQLGTPTAWSSDTSPADLFAPLLRSAGDHARRIALAEPEVDRETAKRGASPQAAVSERDAPSQKPRAKPRAPRPRRSK